jgi:CMP-N-acetylneuraminic acid synthetase
MEKATALLLMRGRSERVKNKNMRLFGDQPLFHCIAITLPSVPMWLRHHTLEK